MKRRLCPQRGAHSCVAARWCPATEPAAGDALPRHEVSGYSTEPRKRKGEGTGGGTGRAPEAPPYDTHWARAGEGWSLNVLLGGWRSCTMRCVTAASATATAEPPAPLLQCSQLLEGFTVPRTRMCLSRIAQKANLWRQVLRYERQVPGCVQGSARARLALPRGRVWPASTSTVAVTALGAPCGPSGRFKCSLHPVLPRPCAAASPVHRIRRVLWGKPSAMLRAPAFRGPVWQGMGALGWCGRSCGSEILEESLDNGMRIRRRTVVGQCVHRRSRDPSNRWTEQDLVSRKLLDGRETWRPGRGGHWVGL